AASRASRASAPSRTPARSRIWTRPCWPPCTTDRFGPSGPEQGPAAMLALFLLLGRPLPRPLQKYIRQSNLFRFAPSNEFQTRWGRVFGSGGVEDVVHAAECVAFGAAGSDGRPC